MAEDAHGERQPGCKPEDQSTIVHTHTPPGKQEKLEIHYSNGHGHGHGHSHEVPTSIASVAWMVIMGDGLHNFSDGLAIGESIEANL